MDYQRVYNEFIADRRAKEAALIESGEYYEKHHILPRSLGGGDEADNLIRLTAGDHYFAHLCLAKIHGGSQWHGIWAVAGMDRDQARRSEVYSKRRMVGIAREKFAESQIGSGNSRANLQVREWMNELTGEVVIGTWFDVSANPKADGFTDYDSGKTFTTKTGWFDTQRFASIEAVKQARIAHQRKATEAARTANTGKGNHRARSVLCIETGEVFETMGKAAEWLGLPKARGARIGQVCRGERNIAWGYRWAYADQAA